MYFVSLMFVPVCGLWAAASECSACKMRTVSAVFNCLKATVWKLWALFSLKSRGKCGERGYNCTSTFKGRVGKFFEELEGSVEENMDWLLTVRGHGGLQMLLLRWCAKENNQTKEYSVECKSNEDAVENRDDHLEVPPNTQCYRLKKTWVIWKGVGTGIRKEGGGSFNLFLKKKKASKISGA